MDAYFDQKNESIPVEQQFSSIKFTNEEILKKKKVVSDLLALRKMKMLHQERQSSPFSENFPVLPMIEPVVQPIDVDPLLKGTILEKELNTVYGKEALVKATKHFSTLSDLNLSSNKDNADTERAKFFNDITRRRKFKLEKDRHHRMQKQQMLFNKQFELTRKELSIMSNKNIPSSSLLDEDLPKVIEKTEKNLKSMEKNLRLLKIKYSMDLYSEYTARMLKMEIEALKSEHPEEVAVVLWIIDVILEKVECMYKQDEGNRLESKLVEMLVVADREQYENLQVQHLRSEVILQIMNELVDEVYPSMLKDLCEECIFLANIAIVFPENLVVDSCSSAAFILTKAKSKSNTVKLIDESFANIKQARERFKKDIWYHTQATIKQQSLPISEDPTIGRQVAVPANVPADIEGDLTHISADSVKPRLNAKLGSSSLMERHFANEKSLWKSYTISVPDTTIPPRRSLGIAVTCLSSGHNYLAVGSQKGDILVYDVTGGNFSLVRSVTFQGKSNDAVTALDWSLDCNRLVSLSSQGCVVLWSVSFAPYVSTTDISALSMSKSSFNNQQLTALCVLEYLKGDFEIKNFSLQGKDGINKKAFPCIVKFHPTLSTTGTQDSIVVALTNGNILKCNLYKNIQTHFVNQLLPEFKLDSHESRIIHGLLPIQAQTVHKIGQDINTEVFRFHRVNVIQIYFVCNSGDMLSLDVNFILCQWKHKSEHLNSFGWFVPYKKFELSFTEEVLIASGEDEIIFEDVIALKEKTRSKKTKSKRVIEQERREALRELEDLDIINRKPWFTDEFPDQLEERKNKSKKPPKFFIRIYAPPEELESDVLSGDAQFIVVTIKRSTGIVVKMAYRRYEITTNIATSLLHNSISPSGDRIHFMLLYDERLPGTRKHVSFIELDLLSMELGSIGPIRINISTEVFRQCAEGDSAHFVVSRVDNRLGTEYIVSNICGVLYIHSLLSGRVIIQKSNKEDEYLLNESNLFPVQVKKFKKDTKVLFINPNGKENFIMTMPRLIDQTTSVSSKIILIADTSSPLERNLVQATYKQLVQMKKQSFSQEGDSIDWFNPEQTSQREVWSHRHLPLKLYMELLLNPIIDIVIARSTGMRIPQEMRKKLWKQDWTRMESYFTKKLEMQP